MSVFIRIRILRSEIRRGYTFLKNLCIWFKCIPLVKKYQIRNNLEKKVKWDIMTIYKCKMMKFLLTASPEKPVGQIPPVVFYCL